MILNTSESSSNSSTSDSFGRKSQFFSPSTKQFQRQQQLKPVQYHSKSPIWPPSRSICIHSSLTPGWSAVPGVRFLQKIAAGLKGWKPLNVYHIPQKAQNGGTLGEIDWQGVKVVLQVSSTARWASICIPVQFGNCVSDASYACFLPQPCFQEHKAPPPRGAAPKQPKCNASSNLATSALVGSAQKGIFDCTNGVAKCKLWRLLFSSSWGLTFSPEPTHTGGPPHSSSGFAASSKRSIGQLCCMVVHRESISTFSSSQCSSWAGREPRSCRWAGKSQISKERPKATFSFW